MTDTMCGLLKIPKLAKQKVWDNMIKRAVRVRAHPYAGISQEALHSCIQTIRSNAIPPCIDSQGEHYWLSFDRLMQFDMRLPANPNYFTGWQRRWDRVRAKNLKR